MEKDIKDLKSYMLNHHDRLSLDISNAHEKNHEDDVQFYKGAQNATHLFIQLLTDIIEKHNASDS